MSDTPKLMIYETCEVCGEYEEDCQCDPCPRCGCIGMNACYEGGSCGGLAPAPDADEQ